MAPKRTRKETNTETTSKRRKNAEAQALFRQRRATYISELEASIDTLHEDVNELRTMCKSAHEETKFYRDKAEALEAIVSNLKSQMEQQSIGSSPTTSHFSNEVASVTFPPTLTPETPAAYDILQDEGLMTLLRPTPPSQWLTPIDDCDPDAPITAAFTSSTDLHQPFADPGPQVFYYEPMPYTPLEPTQLFASPTSIHPHLTTRASYSSMSPTESEFSSNSLLTPPSSPPLMSLTSPVLQTRRGAARTSVSTKGWVSPTQRPQTLQARSAKTEEVLRLARQAVSQSRQELLFYSR